MNGKELWMRIFNTDFEEAFLSIKNLEKDFEDEGDDEQNAEIVKALEGHSLQDMIDFRCQYFGYGIDSTDIRDMIEQLQIEDIEEIKNW